MNQNNLKIVGIVFLVILVLNIILFSFTIIGAGLFWIVILVCAVFAYFVLPKLKKQNHNLK